MQSDNFARKWRPKQFDQLIGQDISITILKNSIFLGKLFPVYLFSGTRGCGKTTAARMFAAAINCEKQAAFCDDPNNIIIPCLKCISCSSLYKGKNPDFIEVDAASHTGVEHIRSLMESAILLPIMGKTKVYLIDEAHMLSRAACNAFLKILEEPPASTIFILATTEVQKIIDTVRSRCFQLFFPPVKQSVLTDYLTFICKEENIKYEEDGLHLIVRESEGCVRDALNFLQQIYFATKIVNKESVLSIMGYATDEQIMKLFCLLMKKDIKIILSFMDCINLFSLSTFYIWTHLIEYTRALVWYSYDVEPTHLTIPLLLKEYKNKYNIKTLHQFLKHLYSYKEAFSTSSLHQTWFEALVLSWCIPIDSASNNHRKLAEDKKELIAYSMHNNQTLSQKIDLRDNKIKQTKSITSLWSQFLEEITKADDRLLLSIFKQATFLSYEDNTVDISFNSKYSFFQDILENSKKEWVDSLQNIFGKKAFLRYSFVKNEDLIKKTAQSKEKESSFSKPKKKVILNTKKLNSVQDRTMLNKRQYTSIDISDRSKWKLSHIMLNYFPGTLRIKQEDNNHGIS